MGNPTEADGEENQLHWTGKHFLLLIGLKIRSS